jgi:predicted nucleotidyltransferase
MPSCTYLLDKILAQKRKEQEEKRQQTIAKVKQAVAELAKSCSFQAAYIFGSLTKPSKFNDQSDIDIAFTGLSDADFFSTIAYLSDKLQRDTDIIQLKSILGRQN